MTSEIRNREVNATRKFHDARRATPRINVKCRESHSSLIGLADRLPRWIDSARRRAVRNIACALAWKGVLRLVARRGHAAPRVFHIGPRDVCGADSLDARSISHARLAFAWRSLTLGGTNRFNWKVNKTAASAATHRAAVEFASVTFSPLNIYILLSTIEIRRCFHIFLKSKPTASDVTAELEKKNVTGIVGRKREWEIIFNAEFYLSVKLISKTERHVRVSTLYIIYYTLYIVYFL